MDRDDIIRVGRDNNSVGFVEVITQEGITRRIRALDSAWQTLTPFKTTRYIETELKAWEQFRDNVLSSWWERTWATGVAKEIDRWELRYKAAYEKAGAPNNSPAPSVFPTGETSLPLWVAFSGGLLLAAIVIAKIGGFSRKKPGN